MEHVGLLAPVAFALSALGRIGTLKKKIEQLGQRSRGKEAATQDS
jgi:hypothetical protein